MKQMSAMGVRRMMYPGRGPRGRIRGGGPDAGGVGQGAGALALGPFAGLSGMNMLVAPNLVAPQPQFVNADGMAALACSDGGPHAAYAHSAPELAAMMLAGAQQPNINVAQQLAYYTAGTALYSYSYRSSCHCCLRRPFALPIARAKSRDADSRNAFSRRRHGRRPVARSCALRGGGSGVQRAREREHLAPRLLQRLAGLR